MHSSECLVLDDLVGDSSGLNLERAICKAASGGIGQCGDPRVQQPLSRTPDRRGRKPYIGTVRRSVNSVTQILPMSATLGEHIARMRANAARMLALALKTQAEGQIELSEQLVAAALDCEEKANILEAAAAKPKEE
jgi:hypothetical protein